MRNVKINVSVEMMRSILDPMKNGEDVKITLSAMGRFDNVNLVLPVKCSPIEDVIHCLRELNDGEKE